MITIVHYEPTWVDEFQMLGMTLRRALGELVLRIDPIGSTAVPGLAAKDRIDIQVTVAELTDEVELALNRIGYKRIVRLTQDHLPPASNDDPREWSKWVFEPPPGQRPTNMHVRVAGRPNQRYALLFRDYLRTHPATAEAYARVKSALATYHGEDVQAYYDVKDPVCDIIIAGAEDWAKTTRWEPGASDC